MWKWGQNNLPKSVKKIPWISEGEGTITSFFAFICLDYPSWIIVSNQLFQFVNKDKYVVSVHVFQFYNSSDPKTVQMEYSCLWIIILNGPNQPVQCLVLLLQVSRNRRTNEVSSRQISLRSSGLRTRSNKVRSIKTSEKDSQLTLTFVKAELFLMDCHN